MYNPSKFSVKIKAIMVYKFDSLKGGNAAFFQDGILINDKESQVNILNIAQEVSIYESIFSPIMRCDIAITDAIGLLHNFPIVGEEIIHIIYQDMEGVENDWYFVIKNITNIAIQPQNKALSYLMECETIEVLANDLMKIRKAYNKEPKDLAETIWENYILSRMREIVDNWGVGKYKGKSNFDVNVSDSGKFVFIIPNLHPFDSLNLVRDTIPADEENKTFLFFQNLRGFHLKSLQSLYTEDKKALARMKENEYVFLSNEIPGQLENGHNIVSELYINSRSNSRDKLKDGYFNSIVFDINPHLKAINSEKSWYNFFTPKYIDINLSSSISYNNKDLKLIEDYHINTDAFRSYADSALENKTDRSFSEDANKVEYFFNVYPEFDNFFPVKKYRERKSWDNLSFSALKAIELTVVIPGTIKYCVGDLFNLKLEEFHGFTEVNIDKALSGLFLITEVKHILFNSGFHSTVLRLNRDSYGEDINIPPKFKD